MAPQGVVHLQNASFWRAYKFVLASLGILVQCQLLSCRHTSIPWIWYERLQVASVTWGREELLGVLGNVSFCGFGALLKGLTSVVDNSCRSWDSNPQPRVTSPMLYPLGHDCPPQSACSDRKSLIFLMLYKENLQDRAVVAMLSVMLDWSSITTLRFLAVQEWVMVDKPSCIENLWWSEGLPETTSSSVLAKDWAEGDGPSSS